MKKRTKTILWFWQSFSITILGSMFFSKNALAFTKLKSGFETLTDTYLIPLSGAVAGAAFIVFIILSYFKQDEYQKKVGNVLALAVFSTAGLEMIKKLISNFS